MSSIVRATTPEVPEPAAGTWSNCLVADGVAYVAGMTARAAGQSGAAGDEYAQAKEIFGKIRHLVEAAGGSMADVVKVTIFVTDISQREKVWEAGASSLPAISRLRPWCRWPRWPIPRSRWRSTRLRIS